MNGLKKIKLATVINNLKYLLKNDLKEKEYQMRDEIIEDTIYFFDEEKEMIKHLNIKTFDESLKILSDNPKSYIRFGDGEVDIMCGRDSLFQPYNRELDLKLRNILLNFNPDKCYVGINRAYFQSPRFFSCHNRKFYRLEGGRLRRFFAGLCDSNKTYLDASCFGAYYRFDEDFDFDGHYNKIENLFRNKKIVVVCGDGVFKKIKYNIFDKCLDVKYIYGPSRDAFSEYKNIYNSIVKEVDRTYLVCIILGMTAKVLAHELTQDGYMVWDVGHLAKDYNAYKLRLPKNEKNKKEFWLPD